MTSSYTLRSRTAGMKLAPMPWILCGPGAPPGQDRRLLGLDRDDLDLGVLLLEVPAGAGDGAARTDARDEDVDLAVRGVPDLGAGGLVVDLRVRRVLELVGEDRAGTLRGDLLGPGDAALHALRRGREDQLRAEHAQQRAPLLRHRLGHRQHELVASRRRDHRQRDAGVAAGRLDDGAAGLQAAVGLGRVDDGRTDAVLHRVRRVVELQLHRDGRAEPLREAVDPYERGVADGFGDVAENGHGASVGE